MRVRAARDDPQALVRERIAERARRAHRPRRVLRNAGVIASLSATAFAAIAFSIGPPCVIGKTALSTAFALLAAQDHRAARPSERLGWVVKVTTFAYGTGLGYAPPATRPMT